MDFENENEDENDYENENDYDYDYGYDGMPAGAELTPVASSTIDPRPSPPLQKSKFVNRHSAIPSGKRRRV